MSYKPATPPGKEIRISNWQLPPYNQEVTLYMKPDWGNPDTFKFEWYDNFPWTPQQLVPAVGTSHGPAVAVYNGKLFMVWKGQEADPGIYYTTFYNNQWAGQQLIPGNVKTSHGPVIAVYNGRLYVFWKTDNDSTIFYTTFYNNQWASPQYIPGIGTSHGPSIAVYDLPTPRLHMVWKGVGGDPRIFYSWYSTVNGRWYPQEHVSTAGGTSHSPSLAVYSAGDKLQLFMGWKGIGGDPRIFYATKYSDQLWGYQDLVPGPTSSDRPSLGIYTTDDARLFMAWKGEGADQGIWFTTFYANRWAPKQQLIERVGTSHGPALVQYGDLFMIWKGAGTDRGIYYSTLKTALSLNEIRVALHTGGNVQKPKQIEFWNNYPPTGRWIDAVYAEGKNSPIVWKKIICGHERENTHTLIFRKYDIQKDMYNLGDANVFWGTFGGKSIRFQWYIES